MEDNIAGIPMKDLKEVAMKHLGKDDFKSCQEIAVRISVASCARISYQTLGQDSKIDYEADLKLYERLVQNVHASPLEHVARCMSGTEFNYYVNGVVDEYEDWGVDEDGDEYPINAVEIPHEHRGWCRNFRGFIQQRALID